MSVVVTTYGALFWMEVMLGIVPQQIYQVILFINNITPSWGTELLQLTECTWPGYQRVTLDADFWSLQALNGVAQAEYPTLTYVFDPAAQAQQTIFGYAVIGASGQQVLYLEAFPAPYPIPPAGGQLPLSLIFVDEQCSS